jgi:hypothetical protein
VSKERKRASERRDEGAKGERAAPWMRRLRGVGGETRQLHFFCFGLGLFWFRVLTVLR